MTNKIENLVAPQAPRGPSSSTAGSKTSSADSAVQATKAIDTVELSGDANQLRQLEQSVRSAPVEDSARVAEIRDALANGTYNIDPFKVADGLLDSERVYQK